MSRSPPRGRLKAPALVLPRVLNSPATLRDRGGWFCFETYKKDDFMALLTLTEQELDKLIFSIISPNKADDVLRIVQNAPGHIQTPNWLGDKRLGYKDYELQIRKFENQNGSVTDADLQIWRPSRFFGSIENKRVIKLLTKVAMRRYGSGGQVEGVWSSRGHPLTGSVEITWRYETTICYEPDSHGQDDSRIGKRNDFIIFKFHRKFE